MFFTGARCRCARGIQAARTSTRVASVPIALIVLGVSFCLDGLSLLRAFRQLRREAATLDAEFLEHLDVTSTRSPARCSPRTRWRSPATCWRPRIALHALTGSAIPDAVAALLIGVSLGVVALDLARRNRDFLIGRARGGAANPLAPEDLIGRQDGVARVGELVVTYVGPRRLWVVARIDVDRALTGTAIHGLVNRVESTVHREVPAVVRIDVVPQAAT